MKISDKDFISGLWNKQKQKWVQWVHRSLSDNHCPECLKLDGGYFFKQMHQSTRTIHTATVF